MGNPWWLEIPSPLVRTAHTFWATCDSYPVFLDGFYPSDRMGESLGGWDGAVWDDFSSWTCPFPLWHMDRPLSVTYCPLVRLV